MSPKPWFVIGAGSMGCLWAAHLARTGRYAVNLVVRENSASLAIPEPQIQLTHLGQGQTKHSVTILSPDQLTIPIQRLLVCTKAGNALEAVDSVRQNLASGADILLLQNGMGSQQAITDAFPGQNVWVGSTTEGAWLKGTLEVCHAGQGITSIGSLTGKPAKPFLSELEGCSLDIASHGDISSVLWQKLAVNCAINGLTALYDCQNGQLLEPDKKQRMDQLIDEVLKTFGRLRLNASDNLHEVVYEICRKTANNHSSTCMDARLNRPSELAYINVYLINQAQQAGLDLPVHRRLLDELAAKGVLW